MDKIYSQHSLRLKKNRLLYKYEECRKDLQKFERIKWNVVENISSKRGCHNKKPREIIAKIKRDYKQKPAKIEKIIDRFYKYYENIDKQKDKNEEYDDISQEIIEINEKLGNDPYDLFSEDEELEVKEVFNL